MSENRHSSPRTSTRSFTVEVSGSVGRYLQEEAAKRDMSPEGVARIALLYGVRVIKNEGIGGVRHDSAD
jgi:hypothetical protein